METKTRPVINIAGTDFYATAFSMELVEVNNEQNRISIHEMLVREDHAEFLFDKVNKCAHHGRWDIPTEGRFEYVWIRPIEALDPIGAAQVFKLNHLPATDENNELLPAIKIAGISFKVDDSVKGFRQESNPWNIIRFAAVNNSERPFVYFDTRVNNTPFPHEFDYNNPPVKLPAHIVKADVPDKKQLAALIRQSQSAIEAKENRRNRSHRKGKGL